MRQIMRTGFHRSLLLVLCLGLTMALLAGCKESRVTKEIEGTTLGIDVARYQGTIEWQKVAQSPEVDFAMIRVGYRSMSDGVIKEDGNGRYNLQEASRAGIPLGVYFFSTAVSVEEAEEEARWVAEFVAKYPITYPVVYDCEGFREPDSRQYHMTNAQRTDAALAFLETIEELGYEGMFYGAKNELEPFWELGRIEEKYKIWVAQYPAEPYPISAQSTYEGKHQMWQYTAEGVIDGIGANVDQNVAYFGYDGIEPPKDEEPPEEAEPDPEAMMTFQEVSEQVTAKVETNLRNIPSQDTMSQIMYTLQNGEVAERIAISSSGWSKLIFQGNTYYAISSYLTTDMEYDAESAAAEPQAEDDGIETEFKDTDMLVTAKEFVNLREKPGVSQKDVGDLYHGDIAVCTGISDNGWARLEYQGTVCYAVYSYLTPYVSGDGEELDDVGMTFTAVQEMVTPAKSVNLRSVPNTNSDKNIVIRLEPGETFYRVGVNKSMGWSKVVYHGETLYCSSALLALAEN